MNVLHSRRSTLDEATHIVTYPFPWGPVTSAATLPPPEHFNEGEPEALGEAAVDEEVDGRVHDKEEVVHIAWSKISQTYANLRDIDDV